MKEVQLEGIVHASRYNSSLGGKQFLGAAIESPDGKMWVIDYDEDSPFYAFDGRRVRASGQPYEPDHQRGQFLIGCVGKELSHFRLASVQLGEVAPEAQFAEVGALRHFRGRFRRAACDTEETSLFLITENGDTFFVANDSAEATVDRGVEIMAYPVQPSPSVPRPTWQYLWIKCLCSVPDHWYEWRGRRA